MTWRWCPVCEVFWKGFVRSACWSCAAPGESRWAGPQLNLGNHYTYKSGDEPLI